jgi:hypothetical protein
MSLLNEAVAAAIAAGSKEYSPTALTLPAAPGVGANVPVDWILAR